LDIITDSGELAIKTLSFL